MAFRIVITNGQRDTFNTNPQRRNGRPVVSSNSFPSIIINVISEFDDEEDGEDFEEIKIEDLDVVVNNCRFKYSRKINSDEVERNLTLERIEEEFLSRTGESLHRPYAVRAIVVDTNGDETASEYFQIN